MITLNRPPSHALYLTPTGFPEIGSYYAHQTQRMANLLPAWNKIRLDPSGSYGQQFLNAGAGVSYFGLEQKIDRALDNQFISTAHLDEIDHLYKVTVPPTIDFNSPDVSGVRVFTSASGYPIDHHLYGIEVGEVTNLEDFYHTRPPTRIQLVASGNYDASLGLSFSNVQDDPWQKHIESSKREHDIKWEIIDI